MPWLADLHELMILLAFRRLHLRRVNLRRDLCCWTAKNLAPRV